MTNNTKNPNDLLIALVGRSNVGKSALFNRLLNKNQSIVEDVIGTTRDLVEHQIDLNGQYVKLVDTGGWLELNDDMFFSCSTLVVGLRFSIKSDSLKFCPGFII